MPIKIISAHLFGAFLVLISGAFCIREYREHLHWADFTDAGCYIEGDFVVEARLASRNTYLPAIHGQAKMYVSVENAFYAHVADSLAIVFDQAFAALNQLNSGWAEDYLAILKRGIAINDVHVVVSAKEELNRCAAMLKKISKSPLLNRNKEMKHITYACLSTLEDMILRHLEMHVSAPFCGFDKYNPQIIPTILYPEAGDLAMYDIILGRYGGTECIGMYLDGKHLDIKYGYATIQKRFDRPGLHPLTAAVHWKNEKSDSVRVVEKTFYVRVRP